MQQVRLTKTPAITNVLSYLKNKYSLLSEAEIIKIALSEKYNKEMGKSQDTKVVWEKLKIKGKKIGDKLLKAKGLKRERVSEEDFYNAILKNT